jgi:hypothetical protein
VGRPKKDPAQVRSVPLNFRVAPLIKDAIDEMVRRRAATTGDDTTTGWFLELVHREAAHQRIPISGVPTPTRASLRPGSERVAPAARPVDEEDDAPVALRSDDLRRHLPADDDNAPTEPAPPPRARRSSSTRSRGA